MLLSGTAYIISMGTGARNLWVSSGPVFGVAREGILGGYRLAEAEYPVASFWHGGPVYIAGSGSSEVRRCGM